jgi:hypothetical protein
LKASFYRRCQVRQSDVRKAAGEAEEGLSLSIPAAGKMVGLSRNGSYEAAKRGEIPVLEFGRLKRVPRLIWLRKLGVEA